MSMSNDRGRKRVILPRSTVATLPPGPRSESSSSPGSTRIGQVPNSRTNIRSACLACRRRRNRCSGGNPCSRCRALETECIYNELQDGRTRALRERGKEELELHKRVVTGLFQAIREGTEQSLLELIRNHASVESIAALFDDERIDSRDDSAPQSPVNSHFDVQPQADPRAVNYAQNYQQADFDMVDGSDTQTIVQPYGAPSASVDGALSMDGEIIRDQSVELSESMLGIRHMLQPLHTRDLSDMQHVSILYINSRNASRQMLEQGMPAITILGAESVSCTPFFDTRQNSFNVATWASTVVNSIPGVDVLFRLAWLCYVTRFLRWTIDLSEQNYQHMPVAMMPTSLQLSVPHPAFIDLIPIPLIRDRMIMTFRDFPEALELAGATINWTEPIEKAIEQDTLTGHKVVSARFESHISNVNNFLFGRNILNTFPELEGQLQVTDVDQFVSVSSAMSPTTSLVNAGPST